MPWHGWYIRDYNVYLYSYNLYLLHYYCIMVLHHTCGLLLNWPLKLGRSNRAFISCLVNHYTLGPTSMGSQNKHQGPHHTILTRVNLWGHQNKYVSTYAHTNTHTKLVVHWRRIRYACCRECGLVVDGHDRGDKLTISTDLFTKGSILQYCLCCISNEWNKT